MTAAGRDRLLFVLAILAGAAAWFAIPLLEGRPRAWDSPRFWSYALPAAYGACLVLGWYGSRKAWRWPALVLGALFGSAAVGGGGRLGPGPLGLGLAALMAAAGLFPAYLGVGLRRVADARRARRAAADARLRAFAAETPPPPGA